VNTRKQEIVGKTSNYYENSKSSAIILYEDRGLNAHQMKDIKKNIWSVGSAMCIKNTLFECFLKQNSFNTYEVLKGKNIAIFCEDVFKAVNSANVLVKKLRLNKKFMIKAAFVNKNYFNEKKVSSLGAYGSNEGLYASTYLTLKCPMIHLVKILTLAAENKGK